MRFLQQAHPALLKVPDQHSPFAGSLLRALVHVPAQVPGGNLGGLQPLAQPLGAELVNRNVAEDLQPGGGGRRRPL
eukprot:13157452-Alexandrium_andersonii.AAC.1